MARPRKAHTGMDHMPRTPANAMAPAAKPDDEAAENEKLRSGEMDLDHLMKAEDIKSDPEKMEYVHKAHAKKSKQLRSIDDLKNIYRAKYEGVKK
jgi:hypothetical protein